ncbi:MAG: prephenate dehydrogenase/arogenate dehydrogenase family protein [Candidatus Obscuribacterales bacterium]|nr:prephenate dehydrogenase/arogenate dehydrogenase family protein [Candidatus Obscuribacterales bacterium]
MGLNTADKIVSIIGFGRFGKLLASILCNDFNLLVFDPEADHKEVEASGAKLKSIQEALTADTIFYCVPISLFESIVCEHRQLLASGNKQKTVIDVLSIKLHAREVFEKHLPENVQAILTHPMFGPDTVKRNGLSGLPIVMDNFNAQEEEFDYWKGYFQSKSLKVLELTADKHDEMAANSQGLAHFVGRVPDEFDASATEIDTLAAKKLHEIRALAANDTWQLFEDLQTLNPYTRKMRVRLAQAQSKVFNRLLPNRAYKDRLVIGIQGGRGSFNEEAARYYLDKSGESNFELVYLHTTKNVLKALFEGDVDRGQFAIQNSIGGVVTESIEAMAAYRFNIVEEFGIKISHTLMTKQSVDINAIEKIMSHPQVFAQCKNNLNKKYPHIRRESGEGDLIDHAKVASLLGTDELPDSIATMGSKVLAKLNNLKIIEENLQDLESNFTTFLWVERQS